MKTNRLSFALWDAATPAAQYHNQAAFAFFPVAFVPDWARQVYEAAFAEAQAVTQRLRTRLPNLECKN